MSKDDKKENESEETILPREVSFFKTRKISMPALKKAIRIFRYTLPYKRMFIAGFFFLVLSTGTSLAFPKLVGEIVKVIEGQSPFSINQITVFLLLMLVLQAAFSFMRIYTFTHVSERAMADVRMNLYGKIVSLPITFFESNRVGDLTSRLTGDVSRLDNMMSFSLAELFRQLVTLIVGTAFIFFISWKLTLFMLATLPVIMAVAIFFGRFIRRLSNKAQKELAAANVVAEETFQSIQIVKAFTNEPLEVKRYQKSLNNVVTLMLKAARYRGGFVSFIIFAMFGGIVGVVWYGAHLVEAKELIIADLFTFILYTSFIGGSMSGLGDMYAQINNSIGAAERILEILDQQSEVATTDTGNRAVEQVDGNIEYKNVGFHYPSRTDVRVLKGISLKVAAGEKIALVGYSGAGKSTIIQLLMRNYAATSGEIRIDGRPIPDFDITGLRKNIAIVPQEVILFGGTIRENIEYGRPGASSDDIRLAALKANAWEFISGFPEGLDTVVGERGIKLSGGQRQRIAIARAVLKDPKILILDEATSSLDSQSEKLVQEALDELMVNRTTIVIAHRLATIRKVDTIYVLKDGEIKEKGTHEELSALEDGLYAHLVKLQFEENALKS